MAIYWYWIHNFQLILHTQACLLSKSFVLYKSSIAAALFRMAWTRMSKRWCSGSTPLLYRTCTHYSTFNSPFFFFFFCCPSKHLIAVAIALLLRLLQQGRQDGATQTPVLEAYLKSACSVSPKLEHTNILFHHGGSVVWGVRKPHAYIVPDKSAIKLTVLAKLGVCLVRVTPWC